jgi:hypothetical protein
MINDFRYCGHFANTNYDHKLESSQLIIVTNFPRYYGQLIIFYVFLRSHVIMFTIHPRGYCHIRHRFFPVKFCCKLLMSLSIFNAVAMYFCLHNKITDMLFLISRCGWCFYYCLNSWNNTLKNQVTSLQITQKQIIFHIMQLTYI